VQRRSAFIAVNLLGDCSKYVNQTLDQTTVARNKEMGQMINIDKNVIGDVKGKVKFRIGALQHCSPRLILL
jgi:hypothetical protein